MAREAERGGAGRAAARHAMAGHALPRMEQISARIRAEYLEATYDTISGHPVEVSLRDVEKSFLACIALGNPDLMRRQLDALEQGRVVFALGTMSDDPVKQARSGGIALVTLACRTAIDHGLPEHLALRISDTYLQHLNATEDAGEMTLLQKNALVEYCSVMQDWRLEACSPPLRAACAYIALHIHEAIRLADLATATGLSPNYLSSLFARELGARPIAYIRAQKLHYARYILDLYDASVATIADLLAFPSASAFIRQFKERYGETPGRYGRRRRH